jgi:hypothetical protein
LRIWHDSVKYSDSRSGKGEQYWRENTWIYMRRSTRFRDLNGLSETTKGNQKKVVFEMNNISNCSDGEKSIIQQKQQSCAGTGGHSYKDRAGRKALNECMFLDS